MTEPIKNAGLSAAGSRACAIRRLYHALEQDSMGRTWTVEEDMLGLVGDVGVLSRLLLATRGTWPLSGDVPADLRHKLAECLWWILVLAERLGVDIDDAFGAFASNLETELGAAVEGLPPKDHL